MQQQQPLNPNAPEAVFTPRSKSSAPNPLAQFPSPSPSLSPLHFACITARCVRNKAAELLDFCSTYCPLVICITETWLSPLVHFSVPGCECYRRDRPMHENRVNSNELLAYGGVAMLVKSGAFGYVIHGTDLHLPQLEATWLDLHPGPVSLFQCLVQYKVALSTGQHSPFLQKNDTFVTSLEHCISHFRSPGVSTLAMGHFNARCSIWHGSSTDYAGHQLSCLFNMLSLHQHVNFSSHHPSAGSGAAHDLVATDQPDYIVSLRPLSPLGQSDHRSQCPWKRVCSATSHVLSTSYISCLPQSLNTEAVPSAPNFSKFVIPSITKVL